MKIMINSCYGGFRYSILALREYFQKPINLYTRYDVAIKGTYKKIDDGRMFGHLAFSDCDTLTELEFEEVEAYDSIEKIERTDEKMINIVKKLGKLASSQVSNIKIVEIPDGIEYVIEEYDGLEWVAEKHNTWR